VTLCQWSRKEPVEFAEFWMDPKKSRYLFTSLMDVQATGGQLVGAAVKPVDPWPVQDGRRRGGRGDRNV
jgi:hypothetical protein